MKRIPLCLLFVFSVIFHLTARNDFGKKITLSVELSDCAAEDSLFLYQFEGFGFTKLHGAKGEAGQYEFKLDPIPPRFFYLGKETSKLKPIILGEEPDIQVTGNCKNLPDAKIDSEINKKYNLLKSKLEELKKENALAIRQLQVSKDDKTAQLKAVMELGEVDEKRLNLLKEYQAYGELLEAVAALNTYLSFQNNSGDYYSELDYFANEFFRFADFSQPAFQHNPWVYESFKEYTVTLSSVNLDKDLHQSYLDDALRQVPEDAHAYQLALSGIVVGLDERKHKNFAHYGKKLLEKYEKDYPDVIASMKKRIKGGSALAQGEVAPDFTQTTPEGEEMSLSDLRGKIVLVDFWASWCGPCRRENPHVKKLYEKYSHKGFEILGVSLDRSKSSWQRAISQDGLEWHHVSDLKGWKNAVAQQYGVRSIPHTILLDQEGRIIARKLRAVQLEQVLEQIFGD